MASWLPPFFSSDSDPPASTPLRVPTERVVPVGFFDDTIVFRTFTVYATFVYDEVLDVDKLHNGTTRLIERKGWDKLWARLRRSVSCVRASFTHSRSGIVACDTRDIMLADP